MVQVGYPCGDTSVLSPPYIRRHRYSPSQQRTTPNLERGRQQGDSRTALEQVCVQTVSEVTLSPASQLVETSVGSEMLLERGGQITGLSLPL